MITEQKEKRGEASVEGTEEVVVIRDPKTGKEISIPKGRIKKCEPGPAPNEPFIDRGGTERGGGLSLRGEPLLQKGTGGKK